MIIKLFESGFNFDADDDFDDIEEDFITHGDVIGLGEYEWTKIGKIDGHDLYLCDEIVTNMTFSESNDNDWNKSDIRKWLNTRFYNNLADLEKVNIVNVVKHPETEDYIFLLSIEEAKKIDKNIRRIGDYWWLRSPGNYADLADYVSPNGSIHHDGDIVYFDCGVRPALLLK